MSFFSTLVYVTFMVCFVMGVAFLMASGLWFIGIPVFIIGLTGLITWVFN